MGSKFKYGDEVIVSGHHGKVKSIRKDGQKYYCTVKFENNYLIPPEMEYDQDYIKLKDSNKNLCPFCKTRWNVTKFNMNVWKDCLKCNKTQEELLKIKQNEKEKDYFSLNSSKEEEKEKMLRDFEKMLDNKIDDNNDDDDDDDLDFFDYIVPF
jgi:ribosomal protein L37AE/L43A